MNDIVPMLMFGVASTLTPGPNNFMMMNSGLNFGVKRSMPHFFGVCIGFPIMVMIVALGFGTIFLKYLWIKQLLKFVGSAYILYLAWCIVSTIAKPKENTVAKPFSFLQACVFQWVNPKAWLMTIGAISIFSNSDSQFQDAITLSTIFLCTCLPCLGVWLIGGTFLQKILKNEKQQKIFNIIMALCLVASIGMILID
jgi:threonine/homoserine/homoserine lactone efflux protein